jgi:hypothetical protein
MYKLGRTHVFINSFSRLLDITKPTRVLNQTTNVSLFYAKLEWLKDVKEFLRIGHIEGTLLVQYKQRLIKKIEPFTLKNGELSKMGQDNKLWQCLITTKTQMGMRELHEGLT